MPTVCEWESAVSLSLYLRPGRHSHAVIQIDHLRKRKKTIRPKYSFSFFSIFQPFDAAPRENKSQLKNLGFLLLSFLKNFNYKESKNQSFTLVLVLVMCLVFLAWLLTLFSSLLESWKLGKFWFGGRFDGYVLFVCFHGSSYLGLKNILPFCLFLVFSSFFLPLDSLKGSKPIKALKTPFQIPK